MKAMILSIKPKYVAKILNGEKTIEVRKQFPIEYQGWVYIYCTKDRKDKLCYSMDTEETPTEKQNWKAIHFKRRFYISDRKYNLNGKVVARFWVDKVKRIIKRYIPIDSFIYSASGCLLSQESCLTQRELDEYLGSRCGETKGFAIHINQLEIFDKPKDISEFKTYKTYDLKVLHNCHLSLTKAPENYCYIEVEND